MVLLGINVISLRASTAMSDRNEAVGRFNNPEDPFEDKNQSLLVNGQASLPTKVLQIFARKKLFSLTTEDNARVENDRDQDALIRHKANEKVERNGFLNAWERYSAYHLGKETPEVDRLNQAAEREILFHEQHISEALSEVFEDIDQKLIALYPEAPGETLPEDD
ncbi:MAG: hypothetical protein OHK93_005067 [Ramalina farinacea]|uniref:Uncharacterized protein n=1 Tax=Ramalina farinacea TaxID=258253 RepID=A0AA43QXA5_9LECA|nr:hypothetical protein [Ramalina farinacea]